MLTRFSAVDSHTGMLMLRLAVHIDLFMGQILKAINVLVEPTPLQVNTLYFQRWLSWSCYKKEKIHLPLRAQDAFYFCNCSPAPEVEHLLLHSACWSCFALYLYPSEHLEIQLTSCLLKQCCSSLWWKISCVSS